MNFHQFYKSLKKYKNEVIFTDDFNIDLLKINDKHVIGVYFDIVTSYSFYPKITVPTRLTNNNETLIDNFLCKLTESTLDTTSGVLINKLSDHRYFILLNNVDTTDPRPKFIKINKHDKELMQNFHNEILTSNELTSTNDDLTVDPNTTYQVLHNVIQIAKNKHMPCKLVKYDKYKHKKTKWITSGIIKSIQYRNNLYKQLKMTHHGSTQFAMH